MRRDEFPIVEKYAQERVNKALDKITEEIKRLDNANPSYGCYIDVVYREDVFEIIDEYREGEDDSMD